MRIMYDAVTAGNVPPDAQMVAGYIDGGYRSYDALVARCPHAVHVAIAVSAATNAGIVLDVETGDATPGQSVGWVLARRAAGVDPSVYCNFSTWGAVRTAFLVAGVAEPHYWIADWNGAQSVYPGSVAHQYASGPFGVGGGDVDLSAVVDSWPGVDGPPTPKRKKHTVEPTLYLFTTDANCYAVTKLGCLVISPDVALRICGLGVNPYTSDVNPVVVVALDEQIRHLRVHPEHSVLAGVPD